MLRTAVLTHGARAGLAGSVVLAAIALQALAASSTSARLAHPLCHQVKAGDKCQDGGGRRTPGGGDKASHRGWPAITGVFWQVMANRGRRFTGGGRNDELLGHHGSDRIRGRGARDVIWGDWERAGNNTWQHDVLSGHDGDDWIYSSHGHNMIRAGRGRDVVWAVYGRGRVDCGPGIDTIRVRRRTPYKHVRCERITHP